MNSHPMPQGACVLILNQEGNPLVVNRRSSSSQFCFPGGKVDPGETFLDAALRETREETGVCLTAEDLEPVFRAACPGEGDKPWFDVVLFACKRPIDTIPGSEEPDLVARFGTYADLLAGSPFADYNRAGLCMAQGAYVATRYPQGPFMETARQALASALHTNGR